MQVDDEQIRRLLFDTAAVNVLRQVLDVARVADVVAAPVKGVVLARWLYEDVAQRPYRDVDIIIAREGLSRMATAVAERGWRIRHESAEMGELEFEADRLVVEIHAEFGRRDLTRLTTTEVLAGAAIDSDTFSFDVRRIDDVDHFLLLVANVTKKAYTYANRHQPADLERLLVRLEPRWDVLVARAREGSLSTALRSTARWMAEEKGSAVFQTFLSVLPVGPLRILPALVRWHRQFDRRRADRLSSAAGLVGLALATLTPDSWSLRYRGLARIARRGIHRRLGRDPG